MNFLKLPGEYPYSHRDGPVITAKEIGHLTIGGLLNFGTVWQNSNYPIPTPLLLVDGKTARVDQLIPGGKRKFFYGPINNRFRGNDLANPPVVLSHSEWAFQVDVPDNPATKPFSYLGRGIYPSEAEAVLFGTPIPYEQAAFEKAASVWLETLVVSQIFVSALRRVYGSMSL